jgi:hypothetical protein
MKTVQKRMLVVIFLCCLFTTQIHSYSIFKHKFHLIDNKLRSKLNQVNANTFEDTVDAEDFESFEKIATSYLAAKFKNCNKDGLECRYSVDTQEFVDLLKNVLPPVSEIELQKELKTLISNSQFGVEEGKKKQDNENIIEKDFLKIVINNSYWRDAGLFVVKELIFLDCLQSYYFNDKNLLNNDEYNELKEQLTWEGFSIFYIFYYYSFFFKKLLRFR